MRKSNYKCLKLYGLYFFAPLKRGVNCLRFYRPHIRYPTILPGSRNSSLSCLGPSGEQALVLNQLIDLIALFLGKILFGLQNRESAQMFFW